MIEIIDPVGHAYRFLWIERRYIARLAALPLLVKFGCNLAAEALGYDMNFIRMALLMLPSFFMDGWLLAHIVRFAALGQRWPYQPKNASSATGPSGEMEMLSDRAHGILTGIAAYMLIRFLMTGLLAFLYAAAPHDVLPGATMGEVPGEPPPIVSPAAYLCALLVLFIGLWAFRLVWLYIPAALNVPMLSFLRSLRGTGGSLAMLGLWLIADLPLVVVFLALTSVLVEPFGSLEHTPLPMRAALDGCWSLADTLIGVVTTYAMSIALKPVLSEAWQDDRRTP
jgi:hypothetical protein